MIYWFTRLREGDNYCVLPDGWNLRVLVREVVECAKVLEAQGSQVSEVEDGKAVRAGCCGVFAVAYGPFDLSGGESVSVVVKWVLLAYLSDKSRGVGVRCVGNWLGELSAEMGGYFLWVGVGCVVEGYRLVGVLVSAFT